MGTKGHEGFKEYQFPFPAREGAGDEVQPGINPTLSGEFVVQFALSGLVAGGVEEENA
jgi:hypothetical protein